MAHFQRDASTRNLEEFSYAQQFKQREFNELKAMGLEIENIVYYQGETHYYVMTPTTGALARWGALRTSKGNVTKLVQPGNMNRDKLKTFVRKVCG